MPLPASYDTPSTGDRAIVLGIRPEDLYDRPVPGAVAVDLRVIAVEALGPETILVAEIPGGHEISARLGRGFTAPVGASQRLHLDASQIHLFDADTGLALPKRTTAAQIRKAGP